MLKNDEWLYIIVFIFIQNIQKIDQKIDLVFFELTHFLICFQYKTIKNGIKLKDSSLVITITRKIFLSFHSYEKN